MTRAAQPSVPGSRGRTWAASRALSSRTSTRRPSRTERYSADALLQGVRDRGVGGAEGAQEGAEDRLRLGGPGAGALEVDVELPVGERRAGLVGHVHGEGRLADAADAGQRRDRHHAALRPEARTSPSFRDEGRMRPVKSGTVAGQLGGADRGGGRFGLRGGGLREAGVGLQDALLELAQAGARVHAEFVGEQAAGVGVDGEGLRLPAAAVQGQHQQLAQPLAQRVGGGEGGQLGDGLRVAALLQVHVEAGFQELEPPLLQPDALGLGVRARHPGQRLAVPQGQRPAQDLARVAQVAGAAGLLRLGGELLGDGQVQRGLGRPRIA